MISASRTSAVPVHTHVDVLLVHRVVRNTANRIGFGMADATRIADAASELARNVVEHAGRGEVVIRHIEHPDKIGLELEVSDGGPGIADIEQATAEGFSTVGRPGMGLPTAKAVMDDVRVRSKEGRGTCVVARKWRPS